MSPPHNLQGPENFPAEAFRNHYSNMAKNAAIVSVDTGYGTYPKNYGDQDDIHNRTAHHSDHSWQDIPPVHNYVNRLIDDIHCEGALVRYSGNLGTGGGMPDGASGGEGRGPAGGGPQGQGPGGTAQGQGGASGEGFNPGRSQASVSVKDIVAKAKELEDQGYDVIGVNGDNFEAVQAIRNATNLITVVKLDVGGDQERGDIDYSKYKWNYEGIDLDWQFGERTPGVTNLHQPSDSDIEQAVEAAKRLDGIADIMWIRDIRCEHPNGFIQYKDRPFNLAYAAAIKKAGVKTLVCPSAGFHIAEQNDELIAAGQMDMVGMATPFFADPEYAKKAYEGRTEDIIPCLMCHDCHGISRSTGPWYDTCNVNPKWGTPDYKLQNIPAPTAKKKVAVIGGGPGGMKAAITAVERGHKVTIYEKSDSLGGLLKFADYTQWKWTYKDFKDYLITQVKKSGIDVKFNTTATPEMIRAKGYDTVLVATGAEPVVSKMPGADADNVFDILTAHSNKDALGKNVVFIGAGRIGTEAAICMAKDGHAVMQLCSGKDLIELEVIGSHNMMNQISILQNHPKYNCALEVNVRSILGGKVTYVDSEGNEKSVQADSVVIYSGLKPRMDEAQKFIGTAGQVLLLGDCTGKNGTIQKTIRSAFFTASQI